MFGQKPYFYFHLQPGHLPGLYYPTPPGGYNGPPNAMQNPVSLQPTKNWNSW